MIFNAYLVKFNGISYCYDIQGGGIFRTNPLLISVMENFHLGYREILKLLNRDYTVKEVLEAYMRIQELEKSEILHRVSLTKLTYEHSNTITIKKVFYEELTQEATKSYNDLVRRLHLHEDEVVLAELHSFQPMESIADDDLCKYNEVLQVIELFLQKLRYKCNFLLDKNECDKVLKAALKLDSQLSEFDCEFVDINLLSNKPAVVELIRKVYLGVKNFLPCRAGVNFICIDKKGKYYNCPLSLSTGQSKGSNELGHVNSVYDLENCRDCFARFLCGGSCYLKNEGYGELCSLIREVMGVMLKLSIFISEKNNNLKQWIAGSNPYMNEVFF